VWDDPVEDHKNGLRYLPPCLDTHQPDVVILLLGTNDLKHRFGLSPWDIASGAAKLAALVQATPLFESNGPPRLLLACPPPIQEMGDFAEMFSGGAEKSRSLAPYFQAAAAQLHCEFMDVGTLVRSSTQDGIHWEAGEHRALGLALAKRLQA